MSNDDQSFRAWSMENSLFSSNTAATSATQHSTYSQKLEVVQELDSTENVRAPPTVDEIELTRTTGSIATAQQLPVPQSNPLRSSPSAPPSPSVARTPLHTPSRTRARTPLRTSSPLAVPSSAPPPVPLAAPPPVPSAIPAAAASAAAAAAPGPKLFGVPNMRVHRRSSASANSPPPTLSTRETLLELAAVIERSFNSVILDPRPSVLVTRAASAAQLLEDYSERVESGVVTTRDCVALSTIIATTLGFSDILLRSSSLRCSRLSLLHSLSLLGIALGLLEADADTPVQLPRNFALGKMVHSDICEALINELATRPVSEEEGSYVAPISRGQGPNFSAATLCIGIPHANDNHWQRIMDLKQVCPELHYYLRADCILPAQQQQQQQQQQQRPRVMPPFRIPDPQCPPISISIAPEQSTHTSGTLGGYIYPVITDPNSDFAQFKKSTFALTCGHVCLEDSNTSHNIDRPVLSPSPVLVSLFRKALDKESRLHSENSYEYRAYRHAMDELEVNPPRSLGSLVWGEHDLVTTKLGQCMSDLAIISCDPSITCRNDLGADIDLAQSDPGLAFERTITHLVPPETLPGLKVFKYGATSKYTSGAISASRIVYWANNRMQSSEFVVRGDSPMFAAGGDSGAWVLARGNQTGHSGLGVAGMIHSYDGEFKEFGLFTPINSILERLQQVTSVPWAVVGVPLKEDLDAYSSSSS